MFIIGKRTRIAIAAFAASVGASLMKADAGPRGSICENADISGGWGAMIDCVQGGGAGPYEKKALPEDAPVLNKGCKPVRGGAYNCEIGVETSDGCPPGSDKVSRRSGAGKPYVCALTVKPR